ncbi:MAG TPA: MlaD family protein [Thermoanaerobaculia bacterium]|nr:MlaD family protein [Thermoanaerobaculia bacterium]
MATSKDKTIRVGLLVASALVVLMLSIFFIGSEQKIFARKDEYRVRLDSVSGLADGNPVKLSGVTIGVVKDIKLPRDPKQKDVEITLMIDRKYGERIRSDSRVRLKKLGLLAGDSYVDITPGSPRFDVTEPGSIIPAQRQTNVDQLISSGEDLVDNLVQISYSLKNVLNRVDRGEGVLGELTTTPENKQRLTETLLTTLNRVNAVLDHIQSGKGVVGKLVYDDAYAEQLTTSISTTAQSLQTLVANVQKSFGNGNGALPALLNDPDGKKKVLDLVDNLHATSENLAAFSKSLQTGQGVIPRLINDKQYGDVALAEFTGLLAQLNQTVQKINHGEGTAGRLVTDPAAYEALNDILIGINESKLLRWLIRNRQEKGIERRYETQQSVPVPPASVPAPPVKETPPEPPAPNVPIIVPSPAPAAPAPPSASAAPPASAAPESAPPATTNTAGTGTAPNAAPAATTTTSEPVPSTPPPPPPPSKP